MKNLSTRLMMVFFLSCMLTHQGTALIGQTLEFPTASELYLDPCEYDEQQAQEMLEILGPGWGYNYDSLLIDLNRWRESPFMKIDSAGASVQKRALWLLTITDTTEALIPRYRVSIHARTHPSEVQATWVTNEIIKLLLSDVPLARLLRQHCIVNIMPMYNPDGVELGYGRENANHIDLEQNWDKPAPQPEAATLKQLYSAYMASVSPIRIALNMHSSSRCKRYFVYHHENGTSAAYARDERYFIQSIRNYWPDGIENWDDYISWTTGTPTYYPESWFWLNFRDAVMALTYEDMFCQSAGDYDRTASAMLNGIADYLGINRNTAVLQHSPEMQVPSHFAILQAFPNPVYHNAAVNIRMLLKQQAQVELILYDVLGRATQPIRTGEFPAGSHQFSYTFPDLSSGVYFLNLRYSSGAITVPITIYH